MRSLAFSPRPLSLLTTDVTMRDNSECCLRCTSNAVITFSACRRLETWFQLCARVLGLPQEKIQVQCKRSKVKVVMLYSFLASGQSLKGNRFRV